MHDHESGATHDSQSASRSGVEAWVVRNLNGRDDSDAGVPAKMRTRENVHLTILRQRILIRRQNSPVKCSRENVHQPRVCAPNSLHFAHALHFAHGAVLKTVISPP